ncbi:hypothetical protein PIB30_056391 [Stylosanthes scabra]|uniref:Uncharacterized protein n=1 Tax=Stylosanthes scabra TaxID=79078 RepID=A0ABU6VJ47_9FABA|nr:hypothetical protein [Stylosanthes scabra]
MRSKQRNDVNAAAATVTQPPQGSDPPQPHTAATAVTEPPNSSDHPQPDVAPLQHVAAEINPVNPQEGRKEGVDDAMTAAQELMGGDLSNTNKETTPIQEDVQVTPQDCAIEVVEATSAEEQIIMQDLSKSDTNLVVETQGEKAVINQQDSGAQELTLKDWCSKTDPKEDMPTDKGSLLMVAEIALQHGKLGPPPSFKLCPKIDSQPEEEDQQPQKEDDQKLKGKEIEHQGTECKTPAPIIQDDRILMRRRLYKWATNETEGAKYERIFNFKSGKDMQYFKGMAGVSLVQPLGSRMISQH